MAKLAKRFRSQVKAESQLRFGPERRQARAEKREAKRTYRGDVRTAKVVAKGTARSAKAADPKLASIFGQAGQQVTAGPSPEVQVSELGAAAGRDAAGATRRLAEAAATARSELVSRIGDAQAGRSLAIGAAQARRDEAVGGANARLRGVAKDAGAFRQGRTGELVEGARDRAVTRRGQDVTRNNNRNSTRQSERNSQRSAGLDPDTGAVIRGGRLDPDGNGKRGDQSKGKSKGKSNGASPSRIEGATSAIDLGRSQARRLKGAKRTKAEALETLTVGRPSQTIEDDKGQKVKVPGVQKVKSIFARAAVELEYDGFVSAATRKRLKALGYSPQQIGLPKVGGAGQGGGRNSGPTADGQSRRPT